MSFILACDLGATGLKAALMGRDGRTAGIQTVPIESEAKGDVHEIDPLRWWRALVEAVEALGKAQATEFAQVESVAISGIARSQVLIDEHGHSVRPALLFGDMRAGETLPLLRDRLPEENPESRRVSAHHPLARLVWLSEMEPGAFGRVAVVLEPKDYLNFRLTGAPIGDSVSSARLLAALARDGRGRSLFDAARLSGKIVPNHKEPISVAGRVRAELPGRLGWLAGKSVITMGGDVWAQALGLGAMRPGVAYNLTGPTETLGFVSAGAADDHGLMTVSWGGGMMHAGGPSLIGGDTVKWFVELFRTPEGGAKSVQAALENFGRNPRQPEPLLFVPYLQGERTPHWDVDLRGAFLGLGRQHGPTDMFRAVLEGVAFANRQVLERAEEAGGARAAEIRMAGGGAGNAMWRQIKADAMDRPILVPDTPQPALLGACIAARTAIGEYPDVVAAQQALAPSGPCTMPDPGRRAFYDRLYALFREADATLAPLSRKLGQWGRAS